MPKNWNEVTETIRSGTIEAELRFVPCCTASERRVLILTTPAAVHEIVSSQLRARAEATLLRLGNRDLRRADAVLHLRLSVACTHRTEWEGWRARTRAEDPLLLLAELWGTAVRAGCEEDVWDILCPQEFGATYKELADTLQTEIEEAVI